MKIMSLIKIVSLLIMVLSFVLFCFFSYKKTNRFINVGDIFKVYFRIFNRNYPQIISIFILPLFFSFGFSAFYTASISFYENILVVVSIIDAILFGVISVLLGINLRNKNDNVQKRAKEVINETISIITFSVLVSITIMMETLIAIAVYGIKITAVSMFFTGITFYLFVVLIINLMIVVKRMSKLINLNNSEE